MTQTHLCNLFGEGVDGGGALLKTLRNSCLIILIYIGHMQSRQRPMGVLEDALEHWISPLRVLEAA